MLPFWKGAALFSGSEDRWYEVLDSGKKTEELSRFREGPDETYQGFVAHLLQVVNCLLLFPLRQGFSVLVNYLMVDGEAGILIIKQLAYENGNAVCQTAIRSFRKNKDLNGSICLCADIGPGPWTLPMSTYCLTISGIIGLCHLHACLLCGFWSPDTPHLQDKGFTT